MAMYRVQLNDKNVEITPEMLSPQAFDIAKINETTFHVIDNGRAFHLELLGINEENKELNVRINGKEGTLKVKDKFDILLEKMGLNTMKSAKVSDIKAPMPGLVHQVLVSEGQDVKKGDALLILEAMKMENVIKAPADGTVTSIKIKKGQNVEKNQVLIHF
jgi:biotin carboxyl carrier protein